MEKVKVVGIEHVNYTRKDGGKVEGVKLYYTRPIGEGGEGEATGDVWFGSRAFSELPFVPCLGEECIGFDAMVPGRGRQIVGFMPLK